MIRTGRSFWVVLILLIASSAAAFADPLLEGPNRLQDYGYRGIYFSLAFLWGLILIAGWLWSFLILRGLEIKRQARTLRQQVGQVFEERFELDNHGLLSRLWVEVRDESQLPNTSGSRLLTWIGSRQSRSYLAYTWLAQRGQFLLGPTELSAGDLFGVFRVSRVTNSLASLLVVPFMVDLKYFPTPRGMVPGGRALRRKSQEVTPYAAGVREYVAGDSLSRIHWPSTARRDMLMVKEFEQDPQSETWIFVDAQKEVQAYLPEEQTVVKAQAVWLLRRPVDVSLPSNTIEYAISAAASIANYYIAQGQVVGLVTTSRILNIVSAEKGERQLGKILENLALLQAEGTLPLLGVVAAQAAHIPRGSTVVLITPSGSSSILLAASELQQRGTYPVVVLIDNSTFGGRGGSDYLQASLEGRGIPTFKVANKANLQKALEGGNASQNSVYPNWWKTSQNGDSDN